ncbi:MAG: pentapeptide repeat-containing protein [Candidatus Zixiibacteriota bacterium]
MDSSDELGEHHWAERPACCHPECTAPALSFSRCCWEHLPDTAAYLDEIRGRAASLHGFAGLNLQSVKIKEVAGPRTNFVGANLTGADFSGGDFSGSDFSGAVLEGASFRGATLAHADFTEADASFANFRGADLSHADFRYAAAAHADITTAKLNRARFEETDLSGATFHQADMSAASFRRVTLVRADFSGAVFSGTRFENCDIASADLRRADLYGAIFRETDLGRAVLPDKLIIESDRPGKFREAAEVYTELKLNFRNFGRFPQAETALYREMATRRRARLVDRRTWRPWAYIRNALEYVFFDLYAGYGTKPWRVAFSLIGVWFVFSLYYYLLPAFGTMGFGLESYIDPGGTLQPLADLSCFSFKRCLYFSFVTLTKLSFTDYEPYGWAKVAAGLEGSFAIVSYTVLLVTIARKLWR